MENICTDVREDRVKGLILILSPAIKKKFVLNVI